MHGAPLPLAIGASKADPPFKNDLGRKYVVNGNVYRLVKAAAAIAAGSNGLQLSTAKSSGTPTWAASLNTTAGNPDIVGAVPSGHTGAIAISAYFLCLYEGVDTLSQTGTAASAITSGSVLVAGTASDLVRVTSAIATEADIIAHVQNLGYALTLNTGSTILGYATNYKALVR